MDWIGYVLQWLGTQIAVEDMEDVTLIGVRGIQSSFLFLVAMPETPSSVIAPSSKARSP